MDKVMGPWKIWTFLAGIFLIAVYLRFLYFPSNIYFGFDQARDAFTTLQLLSGHLKVLGPPTGVEGLFHGPFYYYLYAPFYYISGGDPAWATGFLRVVNAAGVFLIFLTGSLIFNRRVGLFSAILFAFSFEQTQYALYFNHPSLAVFSVTLFYLGLALLLLRHEQKGLILTSLGLGLSLQFEFVLIYLFPLLAAMLLIFRKHLPRLDKKTLLSSLIVLFLVTSSFILSEVKFGFRSLSNLDSIIRGSGGIGGSRGIGQLFDNFYLLGTRFVNDNLISHSWGTPATMIILLVITLFLLKREALRPKLLFLLIWILGGIIPYFNNRSATPLYYYSVGAGVGLLILYSLLVSKIWEKWTILGMVLLVIPIISNLILIKENNSSGVIPTINVQSGMLLSDQKRIVDFIYQRSQGRPFAVKALTMPLSVNTTWSYLFEWYGKEKYGYLPAWIGPNALGYAGNLKVVDARSELPTVQFLIIEPTRGIRQGLIDSFMTEESYFTKVVEEEKIGDFIVQVREKI